MLTIWIIIFEHNFIVTYRCRKDSCYNIILMYVIALVTPYYTAAVAFLARINGMNAKKLINKHTVDIAL